MNCDNCKYFSWYYDHCLKWDCEVDARAVHNCFEEMERPVLKTMVGEVSLLKGNYRMENKERIVAELYNYFDSVYCNSCRHVDNEDICDYCDRKSQSWGISREACEKLAERIMNCEVR